MRVGKLDEQNVEWKADLCRWSLNLHSFGTRDGEIGTIRSRPASENFSDVKIV